ncbi:hypothetical protein CSHISOI_02217 [Colletotrichum shisoi]|uniref:Uncharacterized protein n=1 Tax=Colletotrichum shisoi TaxID=2078593 RepID=A0A5Q4C1P5_9PEZI|nr:hypothetical protein CSHISOI_02217 [Colletotrichum shisoi]
MVRHRCHDARVLALESGQRDARRRKSPRCRAVCQLQPTTPPQPQHCRLLLGRLLPVCLCLCLPTTSIGGGEGGHATAARAHIPARIVEHGNQLKGETDDAASPSQPAAQTERSERDATPPAPRQPHEPQTPRAARATGKPTHPKPRAP